MKAPKKLTVAGGLAALSFPLFSWFCRFEIVKTSFGMFTLAFMVLYATCLVQRFTKSKK